MRRQRCRRWIGGARPAFFSAVALPIITTRSIVCFLVVCCCCSSPAARPGPNEPARTTYRRTTAAAAADDDDDATDAVEQRPCDGYAGREVVSGVEFCPQLLQPLLPLLLENKRRLLRLALDAADDAGGESPLLLTSSLIAEAADIFFTETKTSSGDIEGWVQKKEGALSLEEGRFIDIVDTFYDVNLGRSRPVVIYATGRHACALWDELRPEEGGSTNEPVLSSIDLKNSSGASAAVTAGKTPLALITFGSDKTGSPFVYSAYRECSAKILELPQVVRWFVSHHRGGSPSPKVEYVPIGFGGDHPSSRLQQSEMITPSKEKLSRMDTCEADDGMEMLFQCNNASPNTDRGAINEALKRGSQPESDSSGSSEESSVPTPHVIPDNHFPLDPADTVIASTNGLFAVSPPGTRPDCFRHYEFLLAGNIVYVPDDPSLRIVLAGLPVIFVQGRKDGWGKITCDSMAQHAKEVARRLDQGVQPGGRPPFDYGRLMLPHWVRFVRDRVWQAAAEIRQAGDDEALLAGDESEESEEESSLYPEMLVGGG